MGFIEADDFWDSICGSVLIDGLLCFGLILVSIDSIRQIFSGLLPLFSTLFSAEFSTVLCFWDPIEQRLALFSILIAGGCCAKFTKLSLSLRERGRSCMFSRLASLNVFLDLRLIVRTLRQAPQAYSAGMGTDRLANCTLHGLAFVANLFRCGIRT